MEHMLWWSAWEERGRRLSRWRQGKSSLPPPPTLLALWTAEAPVRGGLGAGGRGSKMTKGRCGSGDATDAGRRGCCSAHGRPDVMAFGTAAH